MSTVTLCPYCRPSFHLKELSAMSPYAERDLWAPGSQYMDILIPVEGGPLLFYLVFSGSIQRGPQEVFTHPLADKLLGCRPCLYGYVSRTGCQDHWSPISLTCILSQGCGHSPTSKSPPNPLSRRRLRRKQHILLIM